MKSVTARSTSADTAALPIVDRSRASSRRSASSKLRAGRRSSPPSISVRARPSALRRSANGSLLPVGFKPGGETAGQRVQALGDRQHLAQLRRRDRVAGEARHVGLVDRVGDLAAARLRAAA